MQLRSHATVLLLALVGVVATLASTRLAYRYERAREGEAQETAFEKVASTIFVNLERDLVAKLAVLHGLVSFWNSSQHVDPDEFAIFTAGALQRNPGLVALEWAPRVSRSEVPAFLNAAASLGWAEPRITEIDEAGGVRPTPPRALHYPVLYIEPRDRNLAAFGLDLGSSPERRAALEAAIESGQPRTTPPVSLVQVAGNRVGFLSFAPVYRGHVTPPTVEERRADLLGLVCGVFRIDEMAHDALTRTDPANTQLAGVDLYLFAATGDADRLPVHIESDPDRGSPAPALGLDQASQGLARVHTLDLEGSEWTVVVRPSTTPTALLPGPLTYSVLLGGMALTVAFSLTISSLSTRAETVAAIVDARTSELRSATRELSERERHLRAIVDNTVDGILTADAAGLIRSANPAAARMFASREDDLIGQPLVELIAPTHRIELEAITSGMQDSLTTLPGGNPRELIGRRGDGAVFPLEISLARLQLDERFALLVVVRDLTERRAVDRLKGEFISTVSHELRTPLASILGSLELLRDGQAGPLSVQGSRLVDLAYDNGERLLRLINDILDLERASTAGMGLNFEDLDASDLLMESVALNQGLAQRHGVVLRGVPSPKPMRVLGDRDRLLQVLTNLIGNAIKFSDAQAEVSLRLTKREGQVIFSVQDQGPGIPESFRHRLFDPFSQADSGDRRRIGGTGLGLSISKALVEEHGGSVWFETAPGKGSVFHFAIPEAPAGGVQEAER